jgi:hypothetical protein
MNRLARLLVVGVLILLNIVPFTVSAATSVVVVITATPDNGVQPPTPFTATVVSGTQVRLDWGYPAGTVVAMIRAKYGTPPATMADGYLVYQGAGITADDNSVDLENNTGTIYYAAWGQNALGVWSLNKNNTLQEAIGMILGFLLLCSVACAIAMFMKKERILGWASMVLWFLAGWCAFDASATTWDSNFAIGFGATFLGLLVGGVGSFAFKSKDDLNADEDRGMRYIGETAGEARRIERNDADESMSDDMPSDEDMGAPARPSKRTMELHRRSNARKSGSPKRHPFWK